MRTFPPRAVAAAVAFVVVQGAAVVAAPSAGAAATCSGTPTTWTGVVDNTWTNSNNWSNGLPAADSAVTIPAGADVTITNVRGPICSLIIARNVDLDGAVDLVPTGGTVDLGSFTLTLSGGTSHWPAGSLVEGDSSGNGGILRIGPGATLALSGQTTVDTGATVDLVDGGTLTGDAGILKQTGSGAFDWDGGTVAGGQTTLDILTTLTGSATRTVAAGATLANSNVVEVKGGTIVDDGAIVNAGILRLFDGVAVTSSTGNGTLRNGVGGSPRATLAIGDDQAIFEPGTVTVTNVALRNAEDLNIVGGMRLVLAGTGATPTVSTLVDDVLTQPQAVVGNESPAALVVGAGAALSLQGTTKLQKGFTLLLDDGADGTKATVRADASAGPVSVTGSVATDGTFAWASGTVVGPLSVTGVSTSVTAASGSQRILATPPAGTTALTLGGPTAVTSAQVRLDPDATIAVTGTTTLAGPGSGFTHAGNVSGQAVTVAAGATLLRAPSSGSGTAPNEVGTIDVPLVNHGTVELDASLAATGGYSQAASGAAPVTALMGGSTLSSTLPVSVLGGGIGGKGTVAAPSLSVQNAFIAPGYRAKCHEVDATFAETCVGTLTVAGALHLSPTSDVQVVVRNSTDHDTLVSTGAATLGGKLTTATGINDKPTVGLTIGKVVRYPSRTGAFITSASPSAPVGFGWRPSYDDVADADGRGVDVHLVDTEAPVMGFAGIPAFTQQNVVEVIYAAVDNSSGVASYDVRWRRVGLTGSFSKWTYPKTWQHTRKKSQLITHAAEGFTYCASVRARDKAGNLGKWTAAPCSAREVDDRFLRAVGRWTRISGRSRWYDKTLSRTTARGATLTKYGTFTRVAVSAYHCPTCGTLQVYVGKTLLKTMNLRSAKYGHTNFVSPVAKLRTAHVYLKTTRRHRLVQIDALGLLH